MRGEKKDISVQTQKINIIYKYIISIVFYTFF